MPDLSGMTAKEAAAVLKNLDLTAQMLGSDLSVTGQIPAAGQTVPAGSQVLLYFGTQTQLRTVTVPDFSGMTRQQAADTAGKLGLYILVTGNPSVDENVKAIAQSVPAGRSVEVGATITVTFADTDIRD